MNTLLRKELPGTPSVQVAAFLVLFGTVMDVAITYLQELNNPGGYWRDETPVGYYLYYFAAILVLRAWLASTSHDFEPCVSVSLTSIGPAPGERTGSPLKIGPRPARSKRPLLPIITPFPLTKFVYLIATFLSVLFAIFAITQLHRFIFTGVWVHLVGRPILLQNPSITSQPVIVRVRFQDKTRSAIIIADGSQTSPDDLPGVLRRKLQGRPDWVVYVDGESRLAFGDVARVMDSIQNLPAKVVMLPPANVSERDQAHASSRR